LNVYVNLGLKEKAFKVVHRLIKKDENNPSYWKILAHLHLQQNDYKKGVEAFTIYSYLNPLKREETVLLGDLNQAIGIPVKAAQYYEQVLNLEEKTYSLDYEKLASAYLAAHKPKKAGDALAKALTKKPSFRLWFMMGQVLYEEEKYENAYHAFKKSARLNKENGQCWFMIGYCALQMDKKERARAAFQKAAHFPKQRKMARKMLKHVALGKEKSKESTHKIRGFKIE
jgi:tetratricopeptide (TPR) repeat protein